MKVLNCVFVIVFDVWTCGMVWEVIHGWGEMVVVEMEHCLVILIAFGCLKLCVDA